MMAVLIGILIFALFVALSFRHFFVQLVAFKLFLDGAVIFVIGARKEGVSSLESQSGGFFIAALAALVFFVLMAAGIQRFARLKKSSLEVPVD